MEEKLHDYRFIIGWIAVMITVIALLILLYAITDFHWIW